jgi:signal transduction histidine kinase
MSHELRTPLNAIVGWTQMLRHGSLEDSTRTKALNAVARNANALARLIEDLLDTSRIATGHLEIVETPVDVNAIAQAAVESVLPVADTKRVAVTLAPSPLSPIVIGDAQRLQQALLNVLSNAVKFTEAPGTVRIQVECRGPAVTVQVRDEGSGIDPAFLPRVFEQFEQGSAAAHGNGGLGLGLHIAKHLVERHGGRIYARSDGIGRGAVFAIELPLATESAVAIHSMLSGAPSR